MSPAQNGLPISPNLKHSLICYHSILNYLVISTYWGFPGGISGKESACQCRRHKKHGFNSWRKKPWSRKWQPTSAFLPGKFHGQRSRVGYSPWGHKELDMTEHAGMHRPPPHTHTEHLLLLDVSLLCVSLSTLECKLYESQTLVFLVFCHTPSTQKDAQHIAGTQHLINQYKI